MTGGGARGAYQAGVLKRIGEFYTGKPSPFAVVAGASAGAINGAMVAATSLDFGGGSIKLADLWGNIESRRIFRSDLGSISAKASQWITDLSFGGMMGGGRAQSLLDARPLRMLLQENLPLSGIQKSIDAGVLKAVAVVATNYTSGKSYFFIQGVPGHATWRKSRRIALATEISVEHVMASSAIPVVFQPVQLDTAHGKAYYGDGCLRLTSPLSPAIRLGANRMLAIGVRNQKAAEILAGEHELQDHSPPVAQVVGTMLNAIFLDHLDTDVEHLGRINELLKKQMVERIDTIEPIRELEVLSISPSVDLGALAMQYSKQIPPLVRYMLRGLGTKESETSDLMSYLLFVKDYARALLEIGYHDADRRIDEIKDFLRP